NTLQCESGSCRACVTKLVTGGSHACALFKNGTLWCWGTNTDGQLGVTAQSELGPVQAAITNVVDVAAGLRNTCAVRMGGAVGCWGESNASLGAPAGTPQLGVPAQVQGAPPSDHIAVGFAHACALASSDHSAWCWGHNDSGQVGQMP